MFRTKINDRLIRNKPRRSIKRGARRNKATTQHRKGDMPVRKPDEGERQKLKTKNQRKCNSEGNLWNQWKKYL